MRCGQSCSSFKLYRRITRTVSCLSCAGRPPSMSEVIVPERLAERFATRYVAREPAPSRRRSASSQCMPGGKRMFGSG